jgi:glutaredoxin
MSTTCPKCNALRQPEDQAATGQCPQCGLVYAKFRANVTLEPIHEPVRVFGPRPTSFPFVAVISGLTLVAAIAYFVRERVNAVPAPVLQTYPMSMLVKKGDGQGIPAYTVAKEDGRVVARLLPVARKNLSQLTTSSVVLFSASWCGYCAAARKLLDAAQVRYTDYDVERNSDAMHFHGKVLRAEGVPVIIIGNRVLLGYEETELRRASRDAPK